MAWTTPETAVAGDVLTAAWLNQNLRDNLTAIRDGLGFKYKVSASTQSTSISTGGNAAITSLTVDYSASSASSIILVRAIIVLSTSLARLGAFVTADGTALNRGTTANRSQINVGADGASSNPSFLTPWGIHSPGSTSSVTYGVNMVNATSSTQTLTFNVAQSDSASNDRFTSQSIIWVEELQNASEQA